ncbi:MAG TPA: PD-(D/E)XK nuclease family protein [Candidatus Avacidaminococcus intestinavium]|uniref:PD-(D/E)XK nuclease family protein n=1 Tax=Candidatus Avacidaminococcus intestinavium TaxID=2840684 RepID=A0A9D1MQQ2_9FIRM|nr:PD-(D/E)XK nuclease family protein [Candidatus Avacidaminococcus intestinavium]
MGDLYCVKLGETMRQQFVDWAATYSSGNALLVLPNNLLVKEVKNKSDVYAVNMDYLPHEILRLNGQDGRMLLSRRAQEYVIKNVVLQKEAEGELIYFKELHTADSFIQALTNLFGEFARSGVTIEELEQVVEAWDRKEQAFLKDREICLLYSAYNKYLQQNEWYDMEGLYRLAIQTLATTECIIPWKCLFFSDFYQFDSLEIQLLEQLSHCCAVHVGMVGSGTDEPLYAATHNSINDLIAIGFSKHNDTQQTLRAEALDHFVNNWKREIIPFETESEALTIFETADAETEVRAVLAQLKAQLFSGAKYEDYALVVRKIDDYTGLRSLFDEYGIPTTLTKVTTLLGQPLTELITNLLNYGCYKQDLKLLIKLVSSNFLQVLYGIDTGIFIKTASEQYFKDCQSWKEYCRNNEVLSEEEWLMVERLLNFAVDLPHAVEGKDFCQKLLDLLLDWKIEYQIGSLYQKGNINLFQLTSILKTLDKCKDVIQSIEKIFACGEVDRKVSLIEFTKLWQELCLESNVILEPGNNNGIKVLEASNVQGVFFKHIFLLGVREGVFPRIKQENWIYNDTERKFLRELGIDLQSSGQALIEDQYFFASVVAAAQSSITFSYFVNDEAGASGYLDELQQYYPQLVVSKAAKEGRSDIWSEKVLINTLAAAEEEELRETEKKWLVQHTDSYIYFCQQLDVLRFKEKSDYQGVLNESLQEQIKDRFSARLSASALEVFAFCPFRFLVEKVWKAKVLSEQKEELEPSVEGDIYHSVLAHYFSQYRNMNISTFTEDEIQESLQLVFDKVCKEFIAEGKLQETLFWLIDKEFVFKALFKLVLMERKYQTELMASGYKILPSYFELEFGSENSNKLNLMVDQQPIGLMGRIDRIDTDEKNYFITDYKRKSVPSQKDYEKGLDMQLPLYLTAVSKILLKNDHNLLGGGYFSLGSGKRSSGCWSKQGEFLPWVRKGQQEWEDFLAAAELLLVDMVRQLWQASFVTEPKKACPSYCPGLDICRFRLVNENNNEEKNDDE